MVADFTGDGEPDIAVATGGQVTLLVNEGDGVFQLGRDFSTGAEIQSVFNSGGLAAADFNNDGRIDLAATNSLDSTVGVLLNDTSPVIDITGLSLTNADSAQVAYLVSGGSSAFGGGLISMFWATGNTLDTRIGDPFFTQAVPGGSQGSYGPVGIPLDFSETPAGATYLIAVGQVGDPTGPIESYQVVRLPVSPVTAVPSTSPASGPFHWNSVADGGGFTFTYHVNNPDNAAIPDTTIALDWAIGTTPDDEIPFGLAYSFAIDSEDLKSPGDHTITVSQSQLQPFGNPSPLTVGGQPAPYLLEVVDPDHLLGGQAPNETAALNVVPLVVAVVTAGFNPNPQDTTFYDNFDQLAADLQAIPTAGSAPANRITTFVPHWDSYTSFYNGIQALLTSYIESDMSTDPSYSAAKRVLLTYLAGQSLAEAGATSAVSDAILERSAAAFANSLIATLLPPDESNALQKTRADRA